MSTCLPPAIYVSLHVISCIASSGVIHGPPLDDQPGQLCMMNSKPSRSHSLIACFFNCSHSSLKYFIAPLGIPVPTSKLSTPPIPTCFIASRSSVIPSLVTFPFIQNHSTCGENKAGGSLKFSSVIDALLLSKNW